MVGLPFSGKTTRAMELEKERNAVRLSPDEWQVRLFGQDSLDANHRKRHDLIENMMWEIGERMLLVGTNVILDYGFWRKEERDDYRARAAKLGASTEIVFMDTPVEELYRRMYERNNSVPDGSYIIPVPMLAGWIPRFQKPDAYEFDCLNGSIGNTFSFDRDRRSI
jgi:predicted kinase